MTHPSKERLRVYCTDSLAEYQAATIEEHLASCEDCAALVRRLLALDAMLEGHTARVHGEAYQLQRAVQTIGRSGALATLAGRAAALVRDAMERGTLEIRRFADDAILPVVSAGLYAAVSPARRFRVAVHRLNRFQSDEAVQLTSAEPTQPRAPEPLPVMLGPELGGEYTVLSMTRGVVLVMAGEEPATAHPLERDDAQNCWTCSLSLPAGAMLLILPHQ